MVYSPWGCKELDTTEATEHAHTGRVVRDPLRPERNEGCQREMHE